MSNDNNARALVLRNNNLALQTPNAVLEANIQSLGAYFLKESDHLAIAVSPNNPERRFNFQNLERFIKQYRPANLTMLTPLHVTWLTQVAPSCVYPIRVNGEGIYFQCCFCETPTKLAQSMVRHYKEQHFAQMPFEIFGPNVELRCKLCNIYVGKRQEHLDLHYKSLGHLEMLAKKGSVKAQQQVAKYSITKVEADMAAKMEKKRKFAEEQEQWETLFKDVPSSELTEDSVLSLIPSTAHYIGDNSNDSFSIDSSDGLPNLLRAIKPTKRSKKLIESDSDDAPCQSSSIRVDKESDKENLTPLEYSDVAVFFSSEAPSSKDEAASVSDESDDEKCCVPKNANQQTFGNRLFKKASDAVQPKQNILPGESTDDEFEDASSNDHANKTILTVPRETESCTIVKSLSLAFDLSACINTESVSEKPAKSKSFLF